MTLEINIVTAACLLLIFITLIAVIILLSKVKQLNQQLAFQQNTQEKANLLIEERLQQWHASQRNQQEYQTKFGQAISQTISQLGLSLQEQLNSHKEQFNRNQITAINQLVEHLNQSTKLSREELQNALKDNAEVLAKQMGELTQNTDKRLQDISAGVEKRLSEGFDKTTKTFNDILQRLALIDDAQKKITELSTNVVSLQEVLADKRSRGAFGEVQLNALIRNVLPEKHFSVQHTLSNGKIADCMLFLPKPTGNIVIDSKFPLESYKKMMDVDTAQSDRKQAERQFSIDIKKHINDISDKYILNNETSDGAVMFIPAEAIFAEIHGHYPDLVEYAYKKRVWLSSPTTLMAILTTARSVLKDEATRKQIHLIQEHLSHLGADFMRFKTRFNNLAKHIDQAASDVKQIHTSAEKISGRFKKIEQVELHEETGLPLNASSEEQI